VHPHLLILMALVAPFLGLRSSWIVFWGLLFVFLGMQFNFQRVEGVWIAGFRNIATSTASCTRPCCCYRLPRVTPAAASPFGRLRASPRSSSSASASRSTRRGRRGRRSPSGAASATGSRDNIPKGTRIHAEQGLQMWCSILDETNGAPRITVLDPSADRRRAQLQNIPSGYVITGGANDPVYGCPPCIPRATELNPARWRLVQAFPEPDVVTDWRFEAVRVWQAIPPEPVAPPQAP
jgi:hypothetical protein